MADQKDQVRTRAEASFRKRGDATVEAAREERAAVEKAADAKRAGLKSLRLAHAAQQEPSKRRKKLKS